MSRDITKATPLIQSFWEQLQEEVKIKLGLTIFLVDVDRDWKVQRAYYSQGRDSLATVNRLRRLVDLPAISPAQNQKKITWTMNSKHITNLDDGIETNNLSRAIDIGLKAEDGKYVGNSQADLNKDSKADYYQIGLIGEKIGNVHIRWGGRFRNPDLPHYEEL